MILASGSGPLPGTQPREATGWVLDVLADELPHLPQLPARGPWAHDVGRAAALLVDLPVELAANRWQTTVRPGRDLRRSAATLAADLDALEERWADRQAPLKVQVLGPWSLTAGLERRSGEVLAADAAAVRDVATSLSEGLLDHVAQLRRRLAGLAALTVQLDEPRLGSLVAGAVATRSGLSSLPPLPAALAAQQLAVVVGALRDAKVRTVVVTEPEDALVALVRESGAGGWGGDLVAVTDPLDSLGAWAEQGGLVLARDAVPAAGPGAGAPGTSVAASVRDRWLRWGVATGSGDIVLVPSAGLGDVTPDLARDAYREVVAAARRLRDEEG